ncbi:MAG TPA: sigma-70 family RNA polymerase sigma factor [Chitinophagaceae bacterium]|nr:sigma-70 family RNA polymerase sigma factor [Chitinophagaceae bacterium]
MERTNLSETEFRKWVEDHSDLLFHYAMKRVGDEELGRDLVQDTYLAAWRNRDSFRGESSVKNWLLLILKTRIIDHFRKLNTQAVVLEISPENDEGTFFDSEDHWRKGMYPSSFSVNFQNEIEGRDFFKVFESCGKKLKQIQHAVFVMKYVDDLDSEEICKIMGLTSSNYWVLIHRAKVQLRACLEKNWIGK